MTHQTGLNARPAYMLMMSERAAIPASSYSAVILSSARATMPICRHSATPTPPHARAAEEQAYFDDCGANRSLSLGLHIYVAGHSLRRRLLPSTAASRLFVITYLCR